MCFFSVLKMHCLDIALLNARSTKEILTAVPQHAHLNAPTEDEDLAQPVVLRNVTISQVYFQLSLVFFSVRIILSLKRGNC